MKLHKLPVFSRCKQLMLACLAVTCAQGAWAKEVRIPTSQGFIVVQAPDDPPVAPAPAPVPVAKPAPMPPVQQAKSASSAKPDAAAQERQVASTLQAWAAAWSKQDVDAYIAAYAADFNGGKSRKAWEQERRSRILSKRHIDVKLSALKVEVNGDKALAHFTQEYKADKFIEMSSKRVDLVRNGNNWLIVKESAGS